MMRHGFIVPLVSKALTTHVKTVPILYLNTVPIMYLKTLPMIDLKRAPILDLKTVPIVDDVFENGADCG